MSSDTEPSPLAELTPEEKTLLLQLARQAISLGVETRKKMSQMTVDNIIEGLQNKLPTYCVNSEKINW